MAAENNTGTPIKVSIEGVAYRVPADANFTIVPTDYSSESIATSGDPMNKRVKRTQIVDAPFICNSNEYEQIKLFSDSSADLKISFEIANGSEFKAQCKLHLESFETEEHRLTAQFQPVKSGGWTLFI